VSQGRLTHVSADGEVAMVDLEGKAPSRRRAVARAIIDMAPETFRLLQTQALPKGDVLTTAKIAGIQAAKKTAELIPLCHPIPVDHIEVRLHPEPEASRLRVEAEVATTAPTGVEMEAMVAAQVAALTVYDMCKAVQRDMVIRDCRLVHKSGGRSGTFDLEPQGQPS
jgi:cyclic pyranopterin phosphate synthase